MRRTVIVTSIPDSSADFATLEALVDRYGLASTVETLSLIACAKADHIRENWQDEPLATAWDTAAAAILHASVVVTEKTRL